MPLDYIFYNSKALIPYFTLGDPDISMTELFVRTSFDAGADIVEIGLPFSDPIADGPVVQASHQRALEANASISIEDGLRLVKRVKADYDKPLIFMGAYNLLLSYGFETFFKDAANVGLDGVIIPDLIVEDSSDLLAYSKEYGVGLIFLMSPLCSPERIHRIVNASHTFIYLISSLGTTGMRQTIRSELADLVANIKAVKPVPVVVGFGISHTDHLKTVCSFSDGAVVGSYLIKQIEPLLTSSEQSCARIFDVISSFKQSMVVLS